MSSWLLGDLLLWLHGLNLGCPTLSSAPPPSCLANCTGPPGDCNTLLGMSIQRGMYEEKQGWGSIKGPWQGIKHWTEWPEGRLHLGAPGPWLCADLNIVSKRYCIPPGFYRDSGYFRFCLLLSLFFVGVSMMCLQCLSEGDVFPCIAAAVIS